jgi:hypothetical protein
MLRTRQLIPPITAQTATGRTICAWDYKQKKNLVIAFLDASSPVCEGFLQQLAAEVTRLAELDAQALVIFSEPPPAALSGSMPKEILLVAEMSGRSARVYLGDESLAPAGQTRWGIFVSDRYGELHAQWLPGNNAAFPAVEEILDWLWRIEITCEECSVSRWPTED